MLRPKLRWVAAGALVIGSAVGGPSCVLDWNPADRTTAGAGGGGTTGTGSPDMPCQPCEGMCPCAAGNSCCSDVCMQSPCDMECSPGVPTCELFCPMGSCNQTCNGVQNCILHCSPNTCTQICGSSPNCVTTAQ